MKKCVKITLRVPLKGDFLHNFVQRNARDLSLEGVAKIQHEEVVITVVGLAADIDTLIDIFHRESGKYDISDIKIEPFLKDRDYRGIFRVIE